MGPTSPALEEVVALVLACPAQRVSNSVLYFLLAHCPGTYRRNGRPVPCIGCAKWLLVVLSAVRGAGPASPRSLWVFLVRP